MDEITENKIYGNYCKDKSQQPLTKTASSLELADQRHEHGIAWHIINHFAGDINKQIRPKYDSRMEASQRQRTVSKRVVRLP